MVVRYYLLAVAVAAAACGAGEPSPPPPANIVVRNRSQFDLLDLRFHPTPSYAEVENLLAEPLVVEAAIDLILPNPSYVTAMRPKVGVGELIAITTAEPLPTMVDGDTLIVFDMAFRIEPAQTPEETPQ